MKVNYITTSSELDTFVSSVLSKTIVFENNLCGYDTEGTGLDPHTSEIRLHQFSVSRDLVYVVDRWKVGKQFADERIKTLFLATKPDVRYIGHNLKYEIKMLWSIDICLFRYKLFDTLLASKVIEQGLEDLFSLKQVANRFLNLKVDKTEQTSDWSIYDLTESQINYAASDTIIPRDLYYKQVKEIKDNDLIPAFKLEMSTLFTTASMEYDGVKLDSDKVINQLQPHYSTELEKAEEKFLSLATHRYVRKDFLGNVIDTGCSPNSQKQVLEVFQGMNIPDPENPNELIPSTGKDVIGLLDLEEYPIVQALLEYRVISKLLSSFIIALPKLVNPVTKRVHTNYNQCLSTGRYSSSQPNLQQIPRPKANQPYSIRECFVAEEGNKIILADYSQIELRVIAEVIYQLTGDDTQLNEFREGKDPYASTAAKLSDMSYEEFVKLEKADYKKRRQNAKAVRLGFNYNMGAKKFKNYARINFGLPMTQKEAEKYRNIYFDSYPGLILYHNKFKDKNNLEVRTLDPIRRRRRWSKYPGVGGLCNLPIQGTSGDIHKIAMSNVFAKLYDMGYSPTQSRKVKIILTVHDELELECEESLSEEMTFLLSDTMVKAGQKILKYCPVLAEAAAVDNLSQKD